MSVGPAVTAVVITDCGLSEIGLVVAGPTTLMVGSTAFIAGTVLSHSALYSRGENTAPPGVWSVPDGAPLGVMAPVSVQVKPAGLSFPTTTNRLPVPVRP